MLVSSVLLGVAAGLIRGGDWHRLTTAELKLWPALGAVVGLRLLAPLSSVGLIFEIVAIALVLAVAVANHRYRAAWLAAAGSSLNLVVILVNAGMPVDATTAAFTGHPLVPDSFHIPAGPETRLRFAADVIPVPGIGVYSLGDLALAVGGFLFPFDLLRR